MKKAKWWLGVLAGVALGLCLALQAQGKAEAAAEGALADGGGVNVEESAQGTGMALAGMDGERGWEDPGTTLILGGMIVVIAALAFLCVRSRKEVGNNARYCFETVLLVAVLLLISWGAFHLLGRIVELGEGGGDIQAIASPEANKAVLEAYGQLRNEALRLGALLGVLGTFFGLVLPVGGHLLQLKANKQEEEKVEKAIQNKLADSNEKAQKLVDDTRREVEAKVNTIWQEFADMQHLEYAKCFENLKLHHEEGATASGQGRWLWMQWIVGLVSYLKALCQLGDDRWVESQLRLLIENLKTMETRRDFDAVRKSYVDKYRGNAYQFKGWMGELRMRCPDEMVELKTLLDATGIIFDDW